VPASTVTRVEHGHVDPTSSTLLRLLRAAGRHLVSEPALAPISRIARSAVAEDGSPDFTVLRDWLDRASEVPDTLALAAVAEAPARSGSAVVDTLIAGIAEKVCDDRSAPRPPWAAAVPPLVEEWSAPGTPRMRASWRSQTPPSLAARGLVIDEPSLWRRPLDQVS
jgi:hypothetical protein